MEVIITSGGNSKKASSNEPSNGVGFSVIATTSFNKNLFSISSRL